MRLLSRFRKSKSIWHRGEDAAAKHMKKRGYQVLARNLKLKMGEIDLLCLDGTKECVVVVEVKARVRKSDATPVPESNITGAKKQKLRTLANAIRKRDDCRGMRIRIDVIAVEFTQGQRQPSALRHYESAVGA